MEKSSKFISLSGWSGIMAGIYALIGLYLAMEQLEVFGAYQRGDYYMDSSNVGGINVILDHINIVLIAMGVVVLSILTGIALTTRKAKQKGQTILDKIAIKMIVNLSIPVVAGGLFIYLLLDRQHFDMLIPAMLIFYGLGLVNGSKYTLHTIRNLGIAQICLGILAGLMPQYDFLIWGIGFGVLHIVYGAFMWFKYERKTA